MNRCLELADEFLSDENAATIVEYTLLIVFVAMACVVGVAALGTSLKTPFQNVTSGLS